MNWYYESGGQQQGPVTDTDLDRLLAEGKITLDTLVWREGMSGWTPLRAARPAAGAAPAAPVEPGLEVTRPAQSTPSPTAGSDVPQPGWVRCSLTGRYFPPSEIIYLEGKPYSAAAKPQVIASLQSGAALPTTGLAGDRNGPAWEQRESLGTWKALVETVKAVLTQPAQAFANMRQTGGLGGPLTFWFLTAGIGSAVSQIYSVLLQGAVATSVAASGSGSSRQALTAFGMNGAFGLGAVVVMPILMLIGLFINAGLIHLTLMMLKGANHPFETTFRAIAYAFGATGVLHFIPMCGSSIAGIWGLVALCIGLGPAQNTTTGKGVGAVLIPIGVCCLGVIGIYAVIFGAIFAAAGSGR